MNVVRSISGAVGALAVSLTMSSTASGPLFGQNPVDEKHSASQDAVFETVSIRPADPNATEIAEEGIEGNTFMLRNERLTLAISWAFYDRGKLPHGFVNSLPK